MEDSTKWLLRILITGIVLGPLIAPEVAIILGFAIWSTVYGLFFLAYTYFDAASQLPFFAPYDMHGIKLILGFLAIVGLIRGLPGVLAMMMVWWPFFLLSPFMVWLGIGVPLNKQAWVKENYVEIACDREQIFVCKFEPRNGKKLPSFVEDKVGATGGKVIQVTPWKAKNY